MDISWLSASIQEDFMLLYLLSDLYRDPELQERFAYEPLEVLHEYQIGPELQALLRGRDIDGIIENIVAEATKILPVASTPLQVLMPWSSNGFWKITRVQPNPMAADGSARKITIDLVSTLSIGAPQVKACPGRSSIRLMFHNADRTLDASDIEFHTTSEESAVCTGYVAFTPAQMGTYTVKIQFGNQLPTAWLGGRLYVISE